MRALQLLVLLLLPVVAARADLFSQASCDASEPGGFFVEGTNSAVCSFFTTQNSPMGVASLTFTSDTTANYGHLGIDANVGFLGPGFVSGETMAGGDAVFSDTLNISNYSGSGFVKYKVSESGFFESPVFPFFNFSSNELPDSAGLYPFTAGVPFDIFMQLEGEAGGIGEDGTTILAASLDEIDVYDANMQPLTGYTLTSASGTVYPAVGAQFAATPEPGSMWLLGIALGSYLTLRRP